MVPIVVVDKQRYKFTPRVFKFKHQEGKASFLKIQMTSRVSIFEC